MINGWFIGDFSPAAYSTRFFEVALKKYKAGDFELDHYHRVATEITLIVSGSVEMLGSEWGEGDIILLNPGEATSFRAITDTVSVVVKFPSIQNDKYTI